MRIFNSILDKQMPEGSTCIALGLFDGLHIGHMAVINAAVKKAREVGLSPCVFTFTMNSGVPESKLPAGLISFEQMTDLLNEAGIEYIFRPDFGEFRDIPPREFADILKHRLGAMYLFCGVDFHFGKNATGNAVSLAGYGVAEVEILPMLEVNGMPVSSSAIREYIRNGDMPSAYSMLGRRFSIDFEVVRGGALGRTIGAPTINQPFPECFAIPRFGVYATITQIDGKQYSSVTNVGVKPTVGSDYVLAETYIHNYSGDLYGDRVRVDFLEFIRPEQKFADIDTLRARIIADSEEAERIINTNLHLKSR